MSKLLLILLSVVGLNAQFLLDPYRFAGASFTPEDVPTLTYWWVFTDIDTNNVIVTNWPARVGGSTFEQASSALRPTNTATGVYFGGGTRLTNNPLATINFVAASKASVWFVLTPETPVSALGTIISDQTGDHGIYTESDNEWSAAFFSSGGAGSLAPFANGSTVDLSLVYTNVGINAFYTNAVFMKALAAGVMYDQNQRFIGADPFGDNFKGKIREFAIFSDILTTNEIAQLHTYATNLYGYTP
jgi:hypothetical protein